MVIKNVLREELENSLRLKGNYEKELCCLPKGSLYAKKIKGRLYYYLIVRQKGKVRFVYKGKLNKEEVAKYLQAKEMRAKYRRLLSKVKKQILFLKRSLRGKEEV